MERARLTEIDALRGLAACGVALFGHFYHLTGYVRHGPGEEIAALHWLYVNNWLLVDLFFVISGYIFAHVYPLRVEWRSFAVSRFARLYPLHIATFAFVALAAPFVAIHPHAPLQGALNVAFLQGFVDPPSFNAPAWSLSVEAACYVLFAIAMWRPRCFVPICLLFVVIGMTSIADGALINWRLSRGLVGFFAGCLLYRSRPPAMVLLAMVAAGAALLLRQGPLVQAIGEAAIASLLLWPALVGLAPRLSWLNAQPLQWLGERSYSIYLIHTPVHLLMRLAYGGPLPQTWAVWLAATTFVFIAADLSYRYFERPARFTIRRLVNPVQADHRARGIVTGA